MSEQSEAVGAAFRRRIEGTLDDMRHVLSPDPRRVRLEEVQREIAAAYRRLGESQLLQNFDVLAADTRNCNGNDIRSLLVDWGALALQAILERDAASEREAQ